METVKVKGVVGKGKALGRKLGYPTANIYGVDALDAPDGVYAVSAETETVDYILHGMANLGRRPTVDNDGEKRVLEVHFFDYEGDLYGSVIELEFCTYIRPEMVFPGTAQLEEQIRRDEVTVRRFFEKRNNKNTL